MFEKEATFNFSAMHRDMLDVENGPEYYTLHADC